LLDVVAEAAKKTGSGRQIEDPFVLQQWAARYHPIPGVDETSALKQHGSNKLAV